MSMKTVKVKGGETQGGGGGERMQRHSLTTSGQLTTAQAACKQPDPVHILKVNDLAGVLGRIPLFSGSSVCK